MNKYNIKYPLSHSVHVCNTKLTARQLLKIANETCIYMYCVLFKQTTIIPIILISLCQPF